MMKNQKQIISVFFFVLLIFVMYQLLMIFSPFFEAFFWAAILTFAFYPIYKRLSDQTHQPILSAIFTTGVILIIVILPSVFIMGNLINQSLELFQQINAGGLSTAIESIRNIPWLQNIYSKIVNSDLLVQYLSDLPARITGTLADLTTSQIASWTRNILLIIFNLFLVIFLLFFFLYYGEKIYRFFYKLIPLEEKDKKLIFSKINDTFASVIRGQLLTSLAQGILTGATFFFLGLPAPYFFGFVTFISTMIPVFGATAVWLPFSIYLFLNQEVLKGLILFIIGAFLISVIDNILKPILIGERIKIPVFLLFFGVLGGLRTYGMTGIFLGPVFIALFFVLIKIYQERYQRSE